MGWQVRALQLPSAWADRFVGPTDLYISIQGSG